MADFTGDTMAIAESFLLRRLRDFAGFRYSLKEGNCYPWELPGINVKSLPRQPGSGSPPLNNCCTFVEGLLVKSWHDAVGERLQWNPKRHGQMMITDTDDIFSPVTAVIEAGMAVPVESTSAPPPPWTVIQGWRSRQPLEGGHSFILVAQHDGKVLTLESNHAFGLDGVGFRGLGNAESFPGFSPPAKWWLREEVWDWERIRTTYPHHRLARLKVTQLQWQV